MKETRVKTLQKDINVFGGINPVLHHIKKLGIPKLMDEVLGERPKQSKYSNSDILVFWMLSQLCGVDKIERVWKTANNLKYIPELKDKIPSHDTINRLMKNFAVKTEIIKSKKGVINEINLNHKMNSLLNKILKATNILDKDKSHTLDIDTVTIPTEVKDAKFTYKLFRGYNPAVSVINNIPVFLEMRNGNVSPAFGLLDHLKNTFKELKKNNIRIDKVRIDGAGYNRKITSYLDSIGKIFYIRAKNNAKRDRLVKSHDKWRPVKIPISNGDKIFKGEIISVEELFNEHRDLYRVITTRHKKKKFKIGEYPYMYRSIVTNDFKSKPEDVVRFYNMRAREERVFDYLRNDFAWKYPAFSNMAHNTVYYLIGMISNVIYKYIIAEFSKKTDKLSKNMRLKTFAAIFVVVASQLINYETHFELEFYSEDFEFSDFME